MAIRTTSELVAGIIEVDEEIPLDPFILAANILTDRVRDVAVEENLLKDGESGELTREDKLEKIERWLSAHFYTTRDPRAKQEQAGKVGATYQSETDLMLLNSHYGQVAIMLDETGTLKAISEGNSLSRIATIKWGGKEYSTVSDVI